MQKLLLAIFLTAILLQVKSSPVLAKKSSFGSYKYTAPRYTAPKYVTPKFAAPRINSNPKYIIPRQQIPVLKTQQVKPYFKSNGTLVPGYQRAPSGSLKPWYNFFHR